MPCAKPSEVIPLALLLSLASPALSSQAAPETRPAPPPSSPAPAGEAALRVLELTGSPYECGRIHGTALAPGIHAALAEWRRWLEAAFGRAPDAVVRAFLAGTAGEAKARVFAPELIEELHGIADGAGIDYPTLLAFQLEEEMRSFGAAVLAATAADGGSAATVDPGAAATGEAEVPGGGRSVVLAWSRSGAAPATIGQRVALPDWYSGPPVLLHFTAVPPAATPGAPAPKPETPGMGFPGPLQTIVLSLPGRLGCAGFNSARLGVAALPLRGEPGSAEGLPSSFVVRALLARRLWTDARRALYDLPHASGQCYVLGGPQLAHAFACSAARVRRLGLPIGAAGEAGGDPPPASGVPGLSLHGESAAPATAALRELLLPSDPAGRRVGLILRLGPGPRAFVAFGAAAAAPEWLPRELHPGR